MCGIGGILYADADRRADRETLARILDAIRHRGPDDEGMASEGPCGLCHTRLSIIDLSPRGHQPMASPSGRYWLTYNGEIYNYRELRRDLRAAGRRFESDSDTEVILHLMEVGGAVALERLEGMFAFALYDRERRELLLVRDRVGIKPLFWTAGPEGFAFASESGALPPLAPAGAPTSERLAEYIAFRHWAGTESLLPGVQTLLPGHRLLTDGRRISIERWWAPRPGRGADPRLTREIVADAVRRQVVSDVPVGIFLSGGVDSALVAATARDALPTLETFTVGFHEAGWDETDRARVVSDQLGAEAHEIRLAADEYVVGLGRAVWHLGAPLNHAHSVHLLALSEFARKRITVALTGEGSDELFGGYPRYRLLLMARWLRGLSPAVTARAARRLRWDHPRWSRLLAAAAADPATAALLNPAFVPIDEAARLVALDDPERALVERRALLEDARRRGFDQLGSFLELERQTYLVSLLHRMDRMSMAAGLECRVPLLDERVIEHALSLRLGDRFDLFDGKKPIRREAELRFGRAHARAPKSGFGVPLGAWFRGNGRLARLIARLLQDPRTRRRGWFDVELADRLLSEHRQGVRDHTEALWGLLNLEVWARVCVDGGGPQALAGEIR